MKSAPLTGKFVCVLIILGGFTHAHHARQPNKIADAAKVCEKMIPSHNLDGLENTQRIRVEIVIFLNFLPNPQPLAEIYIVKC